MIGDLRNGRTVHSLARLLSVYNDVHIYYVSPPQLRMPHDVVEFLKQRNVQQVSRVKVNK